MADYRNNPSAQVFCSSGSRSCCVRALAVIFSKRRCNLLSCTAPLEIGGTVSAFPCILKEWHLPWSHRIVLNFLVAFSRLIKVIQAIPNSGEWRNFKWNAPQNTQLFPGPAPESGTKLQKPLMDKSPIIAARRTEDLEALKREIAEQLPALVECID